MKFTKFVFLLSVLFAGAIIFLCVTWRFPFPCKHCDGGDKIRKDSLILLHGTSAYTQRHSTIAEMKDNHQMNPSKSGISWDHCQECPSVNQQKDRRRKKVPVVCRGTRNNLTLVSKLSLVQDFSSHECASICACSDCETCGVEAQPFQRTERIGNREIHHFLGNSGYMLLLFHDSQNTTYVAKVGRDKRAKGDKTSEGNLIAQQKIRSECGLQDVVPRERIGPLKAHIANGHQDQGYVNAEQVIFSEYFKGVEVAKGNPRSYKSTNGTLLVLAAVHDYLLGVRRSIHNALVLPQNKLKLIDNHADCLKTFGNSIFIPGARFFSHLKSYTKNLDYRCQNPGGLLNNRYPPSVWRCINSMTKLSVEVLSEKYSIPQQKASSLQTRARWMKQGLEYAIARSLGRIDENQYPNKTTLPGMSCA